MKIERKPIKPVFDPIVITLEDANEIYALKSILDPSSGLRTEFENQLQSELLGKLIRETK